jgi:NAD(P)-dependent dehydrogenase (short-subunit alcohol dehydrogenase family)
MPPTPQAPIGSGFGARSTAAEVVDGIDLSGALAVVTGGYSGIGIETVRALAGAGAEVVVPARRPQYAEQELAGIDRVRVIALDLGELESVRAAARQLLDADRGIDILINDAAIMAVPETRVGPGWESQFATNHLGHFAFANLLWPLLERDGGARVVALSSAGHRRSGVRFDDLMFERDPYEKWTAYGQSKSANSLFAVRLDALGQDAGVRAFAVNPGGILTPLQRHLTEDDMQALLAGIPDPEATLKTPEQGAATATWAATAPALDGRGGVYCEDCEVASPKPPDRQDAREGVSAHAVDPGAAERLWQVSARLTGADAFA